MRIHVQNYPGDPNGEITPQLWREAFASAREHMVSFGSDAGAFDAARSEMEALLIATHALHGLLPLDAPRLKLISVTSAGVEMLAPFDWIPKGAALLNNSGAHAVKGGEYGLMGLLMLANRLPTFIAAQQERSWRPEPARSLDGARVTVVGLGAIGGQVAALARRLGMRVTGVRSRSAPNPDCERVVGVDGLDEALSGSDYLVLALPGGAATRRLIDRRRLMLLPKGAGVVNVGRGAVIDQEALCDLLEEGALGGAVLDVFDPEPLPEASRVWTTPNLIVTPHIGGDNPATYLRDTIAIFAANLAAFEAGRPMPNCIDPATGSRAGSASPISPR